MARVLRVAIPTWPLTCRPRSGSMSSFLPTGTAPRLRRLRPPSPPRSTRAARRRCRRDGARQGAPDARPSRRAPRSARLRPTRGSRARPRPADPAADAGAPVAHPSAAPPPVLRGRIAPRSPPEAPRDLLRDDGVRDRAHLEPRAARVAPQRDRVGPLPPAARPRGEEGVFSAACPTPRASRRTCAACSSARSQFSLAGLDVIIPMLDEALELSRGERRQGRRARHGAPRPAERDRPHARAVPTR